MSIDVRLIAVLDPRVLASPDVLGAAQAAVDGGATAVQLRQKDATAGDLVRVARRLVQLLTVPVFINDRADVALAAGAAGVHVGADDLPPAGVRRLAPPPFAIGVSVGSPAEAAGVGAAVDYWSVGAVFATAHKADAGTPLGPGGFASLRALAPAGTPVIGIGGITAANAPEVIAAGAAGVAVIGAIFAQPDMRRAARTLRDAVDAALARRT